MLCLLGHNFFLLHLIFVLICFFVWRTIDYWESINHFLLSIDHLDDLHFAWIPIDIVLWWAIFEYVVYLFAKIHEILLAIFGYLQWWLTRNISLPNCVSLPLFGLAASRLAGISHSGTTIRSSSVPIGTHHTLSVRLSQVEFHCCWP